jgi:hypothetical protein
MGWEGQETQGIEMALAHGHQLSDMAIPDAVEA